jgi:Rieske 2Fe-2S family protein
LQKELIVAESRTTLPGRDYFHPEVFELERERIFFRRWIYLGRAEGLDQPGDYVSVDVAGESIVVVVDDNGELHAFYNVCRHRGSQLCDPGSGRMRGAIKCPYHAWSYSFDGRLIGTPLVAQDEVDRSALGLWELSVDTWAGFLFVSFDPGPAPLGEFLAAEPESPLPFERFGPLDELRVGQRTIVDVRANWKVHVDNYNDCLHCPTVHPELVAIVPAYRRGEVVEAHRPDGSVAIAGGGTSFTSTGRSALPVMPGFDGDEGTMIFSACIFPNMFLDISGTSTVATCLLPRGPEQTTVVTEYLFRPEALDDAAEIAEIVEFNELVNSQDYAVCERVQRGVRSRAFDHGVFAAKDELPLAFKRRYLAARDAG